MRGAEKREGEYWRLESIAVTDFRGVLGTKVYSFEGLPALVWGENGLGKSTIALALEWTLFGSFPSRALSTPRPAFMSPVSEKTAGPKGRVVFLRGEERLTVTRDGKKKALDVETSGGKTAKDGAAVELLREVLGVDQDTFVRAILLQQSKIRGLLVDEVKERNKALDRLLGMDEAEALLDLIKPKPFKDAAARLRSDIERLDAGLHSQARVHEENYKEAEQQARDQGFVSRDLSVAGMKARYAKISDDLVAAASKHGVILEPLPLFKTVDDARKASKLVREMLRKTRREANVQASLASAREGLVSLQAMQRAWVSVVEDRDLAQDALTRLQADGPAKEIEKRVQAFRADVAAREEKLRTANELRALLVQAEAFCRTSVSAECPVCERALGSTPSLADTLSERIAGLASEDTLDLETLLDESRNEYEQGKERLRALQDAAVALEECRAALDGERQHVMRVLEEDGLAEIHVADSLQKALAQAESTCESPRSGVQAMEEELVSIDERDRALLDGLMPFLEARETLKEFEAQGAQAKELHQDAEGKADDLDALFVDVGRIRSALLSAKEELVEEILGRAAPRAQTLYQALVKHQLFDSFEVKTAVKANKLDYSFQVSSSAHDKSAREARLVLSDGQLTAAALALFFALAESTSHLLDLLYVDDPTQNLDHTRKCAIAEVITDLASRRQVIVSTQDEDFVMLLRDAGFNDGAVVHNIIGWNRVPEVKTALPA